MRKPPPREKSLLRYVGLGAGRAKDDPVYRVLVAVNSDKEAEGVVNDLRSRGYRIREPGLIEQEVLDRIAILWL